MNMEKIIIYTNDSASGILVGGHWQAVVKLIPKDGVVIITDDNVYDLYGKDFPPFPVITIKSGERSKCLVVIEKIVNELISLGVDRSGFILGIGGGVVCDIAGFVAATYMRGIKCGFVSTTMMSQVDASVGGKNGVNVGDAKNVIGTFHQPEFVVCDTSMLKTLNQDEYSSGIAELLKIGFIGDLSLVKSAENEYKGFIERDVDVLTSAISRTIKYKGSLVAEDEKENGRRRLLNFGHTYGHAIEMASHFQHGFGVAAGMELSICLSYDKGLISVTEKDRALSLLERYNLIVDYSVSVDRMRELLLHDKKKSGNVINFVLLSVIGKAVVEKVSVDYLVDYYKDFIKNRRNG